MKSFRKQIESVGIKILAASTYPDFTHPDPERRKTERIMIKEDIEALVEVGTRIIRITAGQAHPGLKENDGINWAIDGILEAQEVAEDCGVQLVFENHAKPGVWGLL